MSSTLSDKNVSQLCQRSAKRKQYQPKDRQAYPYKRRLPKRTTKRLAAKNRQETAKNHTGQ